MKEKETHKEYAMKVLKKKFLVETGSVESTFTEKKILQNVRFPFIVPLHYAFQSLGRVYLIMDYIGGGLSTPFFSSKLFTFFGLQDKSSST